MFFVWKADLLIDVVLTTKKHSSGRFLLPCEPPIPASMLHGVSNFIVTLCTQLKHTFQKTKQSMWSTMQFCMFRLLRVAADTLNISKMIGRQHSQPWFWFHANACGRVAVQESGAPLARGCLRFGNPRSPLRSDHGQGRRSRSAATNFIF